MSSHAAIIVPVSHEESSQSALAYAAAEALRRDCPVVLVHVDRAHGGIPRARFKGADAVAGLLLACRRRLAGLLSDAVPVTTPERHGGVVGTLVELSRDAALVVVPAARPDRHGRVPALSVINALAARAECPVVVVPVDWAADGGGSVPEPGDPKVVVAGLRDSEARDDEPVLRAAFEAAAATGAVLHVVHAWEPPPSQSPEANGRGGASMTGIHHEVSAAVAAIAADYPGVPYAVIVLQGAATEVLTERARAADLLVIGRLRRTTAGVLLGSTARDLLGAMPCPVLVVHVVRAPDAGAPDEPAGAAVLQVLAP